MRLIIPPLRTALFLDINVCSRRASSARARFSLTTAQVLHPPPVALLPRALLTNLKRNIPLASQVSALCEGKMSVCNGIRPAGLESDTYGLNVEFKRSWNLRCWTRHVLTVYSQWCVSHMGREVLARSSTCTPNDEWGDDRSSSAPLYFFWPDNC